MRTKHRRFHILESFPTLTSPIAALVSICGISAILAYKIYATLSYLNNFGLYDAILRKIKTSSIPLNHSVITVFFPSVFLAQK